MRLDRTHLLVPQPRTSASRASLRAAFTLVELLVSMALILFIMVILSEAFVQSVAAFSQLKAVGDMQEKMRAASIILRSDLSSPHFGPGAALAKLSYWDYSHLPSGGGVTPPDGANNYGFFRIWQGIDSETYLGTGFPVADTLEGTDDVLNASNTGIPSFRAANHVLHFTITAPQNAYRPETYFSGAIPSADWSTYWSALGPPPYMAAYQNLYFSQWAEVAYFLRPTNETAGGSPLYSLHRRLRVALSPLDKTKSNFDTSNRLAVSAHPLSGYYDVSCNTDPANAANLYFNGPDDLTVPERRMFANQTVGSAGMPPAPLNQMEQATPWYASLADNPAPNPPLYQGQYGGFGPSALQAGDDLLLPDVLSFEVRALYDTYQPATGTTVLGSDFQMLPVSTNNSVYAGAGARVFDTWSSANDSNYPNYSTQWGTSGTAYSLPAQIRVRALQITIRVWDKKTQQTRQITLVQDM